MSWVPSTAVVEQIEQLMATEGTVMFVRPRLIAFGSPAAGARQYVVEITTPYGSSRSHTVEVDASGKVRMIL